MRNDNKIVNYYKYCKLCKNNNTDETKEPCNSCLSQPYRQNSYKPIMFEEANNKK